MVPPVVRRVCGVWARILEAEGDQTRIRHVVKAFLGSFSIGFTIDFGLDFGLDFVFVFVFVFAFGLKFGLGFSLFWFRLGFRLGLLWLRLGFWLGFKLWCWLLTRSETSVAHFFAPNARHSKYSLIEIATLQILIVAVVFGKCFLHKR